MSPVEDALLLLAIVRRHLRSLRLSLDAAYPEEDWGFTAQQTVEKLLKAWHDAAHPGGEFLMGAAETDADSRDNERPVHRVTLGEFLLAQTPVTQAQWRAVAQWQRPEPDGAEEWPQTLDPDPVGKLQDAERFRGDQRPVVNVSWNEAMAFCQRLRLRTDKNYHAVSF